MPPGRALSRSRSFCQRDPKEGAEPSFKTEARVAYDATALYISVQAFDPEPQRIVGIRTRRDEDSPSDWISVVVDSFHDRRSGYEFAVNPAGVKQDSYWYNDTNNDQGWDAVWDVTVSREPGGMDGAVPDPVLAAPVSPCRRGHLWTGGRSGSIGRLNETSTWPLLAKSANGYVSSFGELTGLSLNQSPKRLEVVPYVVGDVKTQAVEHGNSLSKAADPTASAGVDLKYAVKPSLTLTGTINPDFGQVEADPAVVNLSAFETFFSERRPFFVEGSGIFQMDIDCNDGSCSGLFYSRRIGRSPRGSATVPDGGFSSAPAQTTILGAGKLTGRLGAFSIGALSAVTSEENAVIVNGVRENPPGDRADDWIQRHPGATRVQEPVVVRFHGHRDEPQAGQCHQLLARPGLHRRAGLRLASEQQVRRPGISRRQRRPWRCRGDR